MKGWLSLRDSFPQELRERLEQEIGIEECLRWLWPALVGPSLTANTEFHGLRGDRLVVRVPDRAWRGSVDTLGGLLLEAVNGFWERTVVRSIRCVEDPRTALFPNASKTSRLTKVPELVPVRQAASTIRDPGLRSAFLESAHKYFAWQEECPQ
ncbi:MAG: DUF721 domain-containing protein [Acidobacteria bacterium]|nr:DUF721 domain-containing protein [Acidobacteriota bacterium]